MPIKPLLTACLNAPMSKAATWPSSESIWERIPQTFEHQELGFTGATSVASPSSDRKRLKIVTGQDVRAERDLG